MDPNQPLKADLQNQSPPENPPASQEQDGRCYQQHPDSPRQAGGCFVEFPVVEQRGFEFNDKSIRLAFIRKVYCILSLQLGVTMAGIALFIFHQPTKIFVFQNPVILWVACGSTCFIMIMIFCCESARRKFPLNIILLALFTLGETVSLGALSAVYDREEVFMAVGITAVVCLSITIFAFQTKIDFTLCGGFLCVSCIILIVFGIITLIFPSKIMHILYASFGALLFTFYLLYDTQLLMGGDHEYAISPEDYVAATLDLYIDIILIFEYILCLIGETDD